MGDPALSRAPPPPQLGHYFSHFHRLSSECVCCEGWRGHLVQVVFDPGPRLRFCHRSGQEKGWVLC